MLEDGIPEDGRAVSGVVWDSVEAGFNDLVEVSIVKPSASISRASSSRSASVTGGR